MLAERAALQQGNFEIDRRIGLRDLHCIFDIYRPVVMALQAGQNLPHHLRKAGAGQQRIKREHQPVRVDPGRLGHEWLDVIAGHLRRQQAQGRMAGIDHLGDRQGAEGIGFQIDDIDQVLRILLDLLAARFRAQLRVGKRHHARIIIGHAIHRPRAQPGDQAQQPILTADARTPAERIAAEADPGYRREVVAAMALAFHLLDQDGHALVEVDQAHLGAVDQRIGVERAGVDTQHSLRRIAQVLFQRALVRQEVAFVLAGERCIEAVFQQAGGAEDQRRLAYLFQQLAQLVQDILGYAGAGIGRVDLGIIGDDLLRREVLLIHVTEEIVQFFDLVEHIRADVPRFRDADFLRREAAGLRILLEQLPGQQHPGGLAADLAAPDAMIADVTQVGHGEDFPRQPGKLQVIADHGLDQHNLDLPQVMLHLEEFLPRQSLVTFTLGKEHIPGRDLRVKGQAELAIRDALGDDPGHDLLKERVRQVVGEVKIGQVVTDGADAGVPFARAFFRKGIMQSLAMLRLDGFLVDFLLKVLVADDPAREQLLTHLGADGPAEDGVLGDFQVQLEDFGHVLIVEFHKDSLPSACCHATQTV